ncbi:MAG: ClC family H(+)/Cl(-) exchange transporter [Candidatus Methanomethylophilaceae archaeon]|nr:ClC family H(+)/Cl(-) exchange transporter [Candidatus Methanomethylophilaceae archaeon]
MYRLTLEYSNGVARGIFDFLRENPIFIAVWILAAFGAGYLIYRLITWVPAASGSGIPQVKGNVMLGHKISGIPILIVRFICGIIGALFGLSVGREGPSVHIGAATAEPIAEKVSDDELEKRMMLTSGAAAGLSAAFSAPISAMLFALEEIHHSFSEYVLIAGLASAVVADIIASFIFGMKPVLDFVAVPDIDLNIYLWLIPCGILAGGLGWLMNRSYMSMRALFSKIPGWLALTIALLIALPVGLFIPEALGGGEEAVEIAERAEVGLLFMITMLAVKIVFSCTSFGSGVPGGIFMPILAIGALGGASIGMIMTEFGMPSAYVCNCAVMCMAGTLASSLRTPVTAVMLITEMTGSLIHLLPLAICVLIAYAASGRLKTRPIYRLLLTDIMEKDQSLQENAGPTMSQLIEEERQAA